MELTDGSRVGVIGGGPSGTLTSYFLLQLAEAVDLRLTLDIYEPRDFTRPGPASCNMCGGIVSESLVQLLAIEGINLPPSIVQRGIDSYVLHTDEDTTEIRTPLPEMRIAALFRGSGPKGAEPGAWESFDGFLLGLACEKGATHVPSRVAQVRREDDGLVICTKSGSEQRYDFVVGAVGVNTGAQLFQDLGSPCRTARTAKASVAEILVGREKVEENLGSSMHAFLLDIPGLEFAALIPKGEYVTACILGREVDAELISRFMGSSPVRGCLPAEHHDKPPACRCLPRLNVLGASPPFGDRFVLVGDCGVSRLYKDGIGAAYRAAKACASAAVLHGISAEDLRVHYWPQCRRMAWDNRIGKVMFGAAAFFRKLGFLRRAMHRMVRRDQAGDRTPYMSMILWDMFTGSAPYKDILLRGMLPQFWVPFAIECAKAFLAGPGRGPDSP